MRREAGGRKPRPMLPPGFCIAKAEECELHAEQTGCPASAREWRRMADDWRLAAGQPAGSGPGEHVMDVTHQLHGHERLGQDG